ncbi:MAG: asparagine synthase (glutamine-hydrolyzing) [bacterium]|nr:asparagine synthase (glutamine-hydrolyzing) [bacterium]
MCGIAGIYNFTSESQDLEVLKQFTDSMEHRGPDGSGYDFLNNDRLGLGHRRLSILDLTNAGHQPFHYMDRYCMVYNGEIFNFGGIKANLITKGYTFRSETDTEVVIAAYDCFGLNCFEQFNGMWALALWDNQKKQLILSRDRYGVKPLYYSQFSQSFAFASETRAFKFLRGFNRQIDERNYEITLKNNYALEGIGYTIFKDIFQVLPGHYLVIDETKSIQQRRWYDIRERLKPTPSDYKKQSNKFYELFRDACRIRLVSDVKVATALSGGLDSSSIYSTVFDILNTENNQRTNKDSQLAVSAIFPGLENDERQYVEKVIDYTKGNIEWVTTDTENLTEDIERDTELFDGISNAPITAISAIYKGMRNAGITVSLDGHGVDEMLYGYLYMVYDLWLEAVKEQNAREADDNALTLSGLYSPAYQESKKLELKKISQQSINAISRIKWRLKKIAHLNKMETLNYIPINLPPLSDKPYDFSSYNIKNRILFYEFFQNSLPTLLRNFDRAGMMNSVEIRMPFLDYRVVEYIFSLPFKSKIGNGFTKRILREAMSKKMNEEVRKRTYKVGIASPFENWATHYLKNWFELKIKKLKVDEQQKYLNLLNQFYNTGNMKLLEEIWYKLNLELIK